MGFDFAGMLNQDMLNQDSKIINPLRIRKSKYIGKVVQY